MEGIICTPFSREMATTSNICEELLASMRYISWFCNRALQSCFHSLWFHILFRSGWSLADLQLPHCATGTTESDRYLTYSSNASGTWGQRGEPEATIWPYNCGLGNLLGFAALSAPHSLPLPPSLAHSSRRCLPLLTPMLLQTLTKWVSLRKYTTEKAGPPRVNINQK